MDILEHPEAQALLDDATVSARAIQACAGHLESFLARYLPRFYREEQRQHASTFVHGKLTGLQRKTIEPVATQPGRAVQHLGPRSGGATTAGPAGREATSAGVRA